MNKLRVAIYQRGTPCHGLSIYERPLGGTESAMICVARSFARLGCHVDVFNSADQEGVFEGVHYFNYDRLDRFYLENGPWDIFICIRDLLPLTAARFGLCQIFLSPDAYDQPFLNQSFSIVLNIENKEVQVPLYPLREILSCVDYVYCVGNWQAYTFKEKFKIPDSKLYIAGNGVDLDVFKGGKVFSQRKNQIVYASTPFRGLDVLLRIFPKIREKIPDLELKVLSGMQLYGSSDEEDQLKFGHLYALADQEGVELIGPVKKSEMAKIFSESKLLAYPNTFLETFCITALEAQACGLPVVSTYMGALPERVKDGEDGYLIRGQPQDPQYQDAFVEACVEILSNDEKWQKMSEACTKKAKHYDYDSIVSYWLKHISSSINQNDNWTFQFIPSSQKVKMLVGGYSKTIDLTQDLVRKYYLEALCGIGLKNISGKLKKQLLG